MIKEFIKVTFITFSILFVIVFLIVRCDNPKHNFHNVIKDYGVDRFIFSDTINGHSYLIVKFGYGAGICHDQSCMCYANKSKIRKSE